MPFNYHQDEENSNSKYHLGTRVFSAKQPVYRSVGNLSDEEVRKMTELYNKSFGIEGPSVPAKPSKQESLRLPESNLEKRVSGKNSKKRIF